jgi:hypothetical protein
MRLASLRGSQAAASFFDFAAALPALAHDYMHAVLAHVGAPACLRNFIRNLYNGNGCVVVAAGCSHPGFSIRAGIRQARMSALSIIVCTLR